MERTPADRKASDELVQELVTFLEREGIEIKGARGMEEFKTPPLIENEGFGSAQAQRADVIGFDSRHHRVVFGLVRQDRKSLDSENALEQYNVFLDHNASLGQQASILYVMMPQALVGEFASIITHYIHRDYWHRIIAVGSSPGPQATG